MMVNIGRSMIPRKKGSTPPKMTAPKEYMPKWYDDGTVEVKKQSVDTMKNILLGWVSKTGNKRGRIPKPVINKKTGKKRMV